MPNPKIRREKYRKIETSKIIGFLYKLMTLLYTSEAYNIYIYSIPERNDEKKNVLCKLIYYNIYIYEKDFYGFVCSASLNRQSRPRTMKLLHS